MTTATGQLIDGVFASEAIDSSGEVLEIDGLDISTFDEGRGLANYEHKGHDGDSNGQEIVGKIVYCRKIRKESDCTNERETLFWKKVKLPFLYGIVRLYDGAGHEGAKALAAIIRDSIANDEPIVVGFSIEGSTIEKDNKTNRLKSTIARKVALTMSPCNKQAASGLLSDPNAPEGFDKNPGGTDILAMVPNANTTKKAEHSDPRYLRLGGTEAIYGVEITKAMTAGSYGGAPGSLTDGGALQREDRMRVLKASAAAAFRDWDRVTPFRKFLKSKLPEASDEFVEHFADIVDRKLFRMRKAAEVILSLRKDGKVPKAPKKSIASLKPALEPLTIQGKEVPPAPEGTRATSFDPKSGILTTQRGIFHASTPSKPHPHLADKQNVAGHFADVLKEQRPHHQLAMKNWFTVNDRYTKGTLPSSVISHAMAFAMMSPGVPVPIQETMYGHFVDALHAKGHEHATKENWDEVQKEWMSRNRSGLPQHARDHFKGLEEHIRAGHGTGGFIGYSKPGKFAEYYGDYLKQHHDDVVNAINTSKGDSHQTARRLTEVRGIAPKLARYTLGMMGAGDMVVPDTHFTRHYFGARPDATGHRFGSSPDTASIEHLKKALLNSAGAHDVLQGIDEHYFNNHDAVKAVLNDPTIGPYFKGKERQAIFPAFWHHWISIPEHEKRLGMEPLGATNDGTDHAPFWDAVKPLLNKAEPEYDPELHVKTAMQHHRWSEEYGPTQALGLYYRYLVPKLLANDALAGPALVRKFEALQVDFLAALRKDESKPQAAPAATYMFQGRKVKPGHGVRRDPGGKLKTFAILGMEENGTAYAVPSEKLGAHQHSDIVRFPRDSTRFKIHARPETTDTPLRITAKEHGVGEYLRHDHTRALAEGFDFGAPKKGATQGVGMHRNFWTKTPAGQQTFVKVDKEKTAFGYIPEARNEGIFHNLAHDFFGLGQYVAPTAVVRHPVTGVEHAIIQHVPGTEGDHTPGLRSKLQPFHDSGDTDRMAVMDAVMGNGDRHGHNFMMDDKAGMHLIDHGYTLETGTNGGLYPPAYWVSNDQGPGHEHAAMHPDAVKWAQGLEHNELEAQLRQHEVPEEAVKAASGRLRNIQRRLTKNPYATRDAVWRGAWRPFVDDKAKTG